MESQVYGYAVYQHRITMIRRRDPGHFGTFYPDGTVNNDLLTRVSIQPDQILGPVVIAILLFIAVLANFLIRGMCLGLAIRLLIS